MAPMTLLSLPLVERLLATAMTRGADFAEPASRAATIASARLRRSPTGIAKSVSVIPDGSEVIVTGYSVGYATVAYAA